MIVPAMNFFFTGQVFLNFIKFDNWLLLEVNSLLCLNLIILLF